MSLEYEYKQLQKDYEALESRGVDWLTLPAMTDLNEAWYGITIDKKKYRIALEDETEDTVYLKIVKKPLTTGEE
jgi:hypothetical protein